MSIQFELEDLVRKNRSFRRFHQKHKIKMDTLHDLVNLARLSASAANIQPIKYILSCNVEINEEIFSCLSWAGYLKDWPGPIKGERPSSYIVILGDTTKAKNYWCDHGIAAQSILLGACEKGLGGCILGSIKKNKLKNVLNIDDELEILLVIALGKPKETVVIESVDDTNGSIKYWRDNQGVHHVPKRSLNEIIFSKYE